MEENGIKIHCAHDEMVDLSSLVPFDKNPNRHSEEQVEMLAEIFKYQGIRNPIKARRDDRVISSGHCRAMAAATIGMKRFPVDWQDYKNYDQFYADVVADNALNHQSELDLKIINLEIPELGPDIDIKMLGLRDFNLDASDKPAPKQYKCPVCHHEAPLKAFQVNA